MTTTERTPQIVLSEAELHELHEMQLDIAKQVKRVCDKHGLDYFLLAGTLLGAVRHGGFIPWDDDMDLGMPRDSYDRFLEVAPHELGPKFFVQTLETDPGYGLCFAKVRLNGTILVELPSANTNAHNGIFIDIFPFDNMPDSNAMMHLQEIITSVIKRMIIMRQGYKPWLATGREMTITDRAFLAAARLIPIATLRSSMNWSMRIANGADTEFMTAIGGSYGYKRERINRKYTVQLEEMLFGDTKFKSLSDPHDYLSKLYGDYMKIPSIKQRISRHGIIRLSFRTDAR